MARTFSIKALAELIAEGYDTAAAAAEFNLRVDLIQKVQATEDYRKQLEIELGRRTSPGGISLDATANFIQEITTTADTLTEIRFTYKARESGSSWDIEWYESFSELQSGSNEITAPPTPTFDPTSPRTTEGTHIGQLSFTPAVVGRFFIKFGVDADNAEFVAVDLTVNSSSGDRPFDFSSEDDFTVVEGQNAVTDRVFWEQGVPAIIPFGLDDIAIRFYRDNNGTDRILTTDSDYQVDGERLDEIVTLENFSDNGDGTGSFDCKVDPSGIDVMLFMMERTIYFRYFVDQPEMTEPTPTTQTGLPLFTRK